LSAEAMQRVRKSGAPKQQLAAWTSIWADRAGVAVVDFQSRFAANRYTDVVFVERQTVGMAARRSIHIRSPASWPDRLRRILDHAVRGHRRTLERASSDRKPHEPFGLEDNGRYPRTRPSAEQ